MSKLSVYVYISYIYCTLPRVIISLYGLDDCVQRFNTDFTMKIRFPRGTNISLVVDLSRPDINCSQRRVQCAPLDLYRKSSARSVVLTTDCI